MDSTKLQGADLATHDAQDQQARKLMEAYTSLKQEQITPTT